MRTRREFLRAMGLAGAALAVRGCGNGDGGGGGPTPKPNGVSPPPVGGAGKPRPNVIIVLTDDQGYGDLRCHGNDVIRTPNIDRLHDESVRLTDFHVAPVCTPTRGQLLTGRDALRNGAFSWGYGRQFIRKSVATMGQIFAANGYRTGQFGKWHLGDNYPYRPQDCGFHEAIHHGGASIYQTPDYWDNDYFDDYFTHNGRVEQFAGYCTDVWFDQAMRFINTCRADDRPFLVYLPTNAAHTPLFVPERYRKAYLDKGLGHNVASFFGMITSIDENMGRLDGFLRRAGLRDNTIVLWITDNGGTFGVPTFNAGMRGKKGSLYEGGHRVPCFLRWPEGDVGSPRDIDHVTQIQDILPTLIDLCDLKPPEKASFDGMSLAATLRDETQDFDSRMMVVQWSRTVQPRKWNATVLWKKWRFVLGRELYDVSVDPGQKANLAKARGDVVKRMKDHYETWWSGVQEAVADIGHIVIGSDHANPTRLSCNDWFGYKGKGNVTLQKEIRLGRNFNGVWNIEVDRAGRYEFSLCRWPREAGAAIGAALPEYKAVDDSMDYNGKLAYPPGKALAIAKARLKIADVDKSANVDPNARSVTFTVDLKAGKTTMQTWFLDGGGKQVCGAYYVYVKRM